MKPDQFSLPNPGGESIKLAMNILGKEPPQSTADYYRNMGSKKEVKTNVSKNDMAPSLTGADGVFGRSKPTEQPNILPNLPSPSVFQNPPGPPSIMDSFMFGGNDNNSGYSEIKALDPTGSHINQDERIKHMVNLPPMRNDLKELSGPPSPPNPNVLIMEHFEKRAKLIFFKRQLIVGEQKCQIVDIEMFRSPDPFTPMDSRLLVKDHFYFHRKCVYGDDDPNGDGNNGHWVYSTGRRKGLYITFGMEGVFEAVLIRGIVTPTGFVEGPGQVVDYIMGALAYDSLDALVIGLQKDSGTNDGSIPVKCDGRKLNLRKFKNSPRKILNGPRISIRLPKTTAPYDHYCQTIARPYRFTCRPDLIKQGRHYMAMYLRIKGVPDHQIITDLKLPVDVLLTWAGHVNKGQSKTIDFFIGEERIPKPSIKDDLVRYGCFQQLEF